MKKIIGGLTIILILALIFIKGWWENQLSPVSFDTTVKTVIIPKGYSVSEIADKLKEESLIKSDFVFEMYVRQRGLADNMQAGTFRLSPSMSVEKLTEKLQSGAEEVWITFPEGIRVEEMAEKIEAALGIKKEDFLKESKEGYMFPDTYLFPKYMNAKQVADLLKNTFNQKLTAEMKEKIKKQGLTEEEGVILASIVEREARSDEVRTKVASILLRRFKIGMGLQADATVQYILGKQPGTEGWWKKRILHEDLKIPSLYNTYIHAGLPPAPICNPSLSSLNAVANAHSTTYLYYFHDTKGNSYYGRTLEEHNENLANHR